jgi:3-methyladenine DNA glycosylase AlkC
MAEPLKNQFGAGVPRTIARMVAAVHPAFGERAFVNDALDGYEPLELMDRARRIAQALHRHLPQDYPQAVAILVASLGPIAERTEDSTEERTEDRTEGSAMASFLYLPHVLFVARFGLDHFEPSMRAQYELTQRFTAEFSIRAYLERHPAATLARLAEWASDPSVHVRRLVSEGTRPRLPWASRLRAFQQDPRPVLDLLERLKDDPELYVRRSVANNLNDIGKDHPALLVETARRWLRGASEQRHALVRHALRSAVKRGDAAALAVLGYGQAATAAVRNVNIAPGSAKIGGRIAIAFDLVNTQPQSQRWMVDLRVHYVKADGALRPKVFKLRACDVEPRGTVRIAKTLSLAQMTTRTHRPGTHPVEVMVNGLVLRVGEFLLRQA